MHRTKVVVPLFPWYNTQPIDCQSACVKPLLVLYIWRLSSTSGFNPTSILKPVTIKSKSWIEVPNTSDLPLCLSICNDTTSISESNYALGQKEHIISFEGFSSSTHIASKEFGDRWVKDKRSIVKIAQYLIFCKKEFYCCYYLFFASLGILHPHNKITKLESKKK